MNMTTSDYIGLFSAIAAALSTVFAGISILVAISAYRKSREDDFLKNFRLGLLSIRETTRAIDRKLSEPYFCDIARRIVENLKRILPSITGPADFVTYIVDPANHNHVAAAIHLGRLEAPMMNEIELHIEFLQRQPYQFRERFPVLFRVVNSLNAYSIRSGRGIISPKLFNETIGTPELVAEHLKPEIDKRTTLQEALCETEDFIAAAPAQVLESTEKVFNEVFSLLALLIDHYLKRSDAKLQLISKKERQFERQAMLVDKPTNIEDAYELLCLIRDEFSVAEWDNIVEKKTRIYQFAHAKDDAKGKKG